MSKLNPSLVGEIMDNFEQGTNLDLPVLMADARILSCQAYFYADALGELGKRHRRAKVHRKQLFAYLRDKYRGEGDSVAGAESKAEVNEEYKVAVKMEEEAEGSYNHGNLLLKAINKVLDQMRQEISNLKQEREHINSLNG